MKKDQAFIRVFASVALFGLVGCSTVTSVNPIGRALEMDLSAELSGTWMGAEGNQLQIHCDSAGHLAYAVTEWKDDQGAFVLETGDGVLRSIGERVFFNFIEDPEAERPRYSFLLLREMDGQLVVWLPNIDQFRKLVEDQVLAAEVVEGSEPTNVVLTGSSEEIANILETLDLSDLFDWAEPAIALVRVRGER